MRSLGRKRVDAQAAACGCFPAAPSLRLFYRLFLLLGATFVAVLFATGPAEADDGSGPPGDVSVNSGTESQPVTEVSEQGTETVMGTAESLEAVTDPVPDPATDPVSDPVPDPVPDPVSDPVADPVSPPVTDPVTDPVSPPVIDPVSPPVIDPVSPPVPDPVIDPVTDPLVEVVEPVLPPVIDPVVEVVEPVVVPLPVPGSPPVAAAAVALAVPSPTVCGSVAGQESVETGWATAAADTGADSGDMIEGIDGTRTVPEGPAQAPTAPSAPCAPGHGPASVSGSGGLAPSLGVLDNSDDGAALSADRFAAGDDTVPHGRAALLRTWPG